SDALEEHRLQIGQTLEQVSDAAHDGLQGAMPLANGIRNVLTSYGGHRGAIDETTNSVQQMASYLKAVSEHVETLAAAAEESSSSILEMAASNDEVAENMVNLAASVQQTATSIEEMTFSIKEVAKNIEGLAGAAEETSSSMNEMDI